MTNEQLKVLKQVDEMLNEECMPTYSKLLSLLRDEVTMAEHRIRLFKEAVDNGWYTTR